MIEGFGREMRGAMEAITAREKAGSKGLCRRCRWHDPAREKAGKSTGKMLPWRLVLVWIYLWNCFCVVASVYQRLNHERGGQTSHSHLLLIQRSESERERAILYRWGVLGVCSVWLIIIPSVQGL
jgi:hypothetical protein